MNKLILNLASFVAMVLLHFSLQAGDNVVCVSGTAFSEASCPSGFILSVNVNTIYGRSCLTGRKGVCWNNNDHTPRVVGTAPYCSAGGQDCKQGETWLGLLGGGGELCGDDSK